MMRGSMGVSMKATLLGVWLLAVPTSGYAQTAGGSDVARGESVFERAYEAYTGGNFHQAAPLFEEAATYFPHCPTSTVLLGKSLEQMGRLGEAYETYVSVSPKASSADEAPPCAEARREAQARVRSLEPKVGWLRLEVSSSDAAEKTAQLWVTLPNAPGPAANRQRYARRLPARSAGSAEPAQTRVWERLAVTAGAIVIAVDAQGSTSQTLTVTPGATATVTFGSASAPAQGQEPAAESLSDSLAETQDSRIAYGEPWMWIGGAGVAGVVLGTITGLVASSKTDTVRAECDSAAQLCTPQGIDARDSAETFGWVSNISLGVGIAGVVAAGVLYLNADAAPATQVGSVRLLPGVRVESTSAGADGATLSVAW
jgi:hypothetical protein